VKYSFHYMKIGEDNFNPAPYPLLLSSQKILKLKWSMDNKKKLSQPWEAMEKSIGSGLSLSSDLHKILPKNMKDYSCLKS
jgi:hypothetical protein